MVVQVLGPAGNDPAIRKHARALRARHLRIGDELLQRIQIDGIERHESITLEDLERLVAIDKRAQFMRMIIIDLLIALRRPVDPEARAQARRLLEEK